MKTVCGTILGTKVKISRQKKGKLKKSTSDKRLICFCSKDLFAACFKFSKTGLGIKVGPRQAEYWSIACVSFIGNQVVAPPSIISTNGCLLWR